MVNSYSISFAICKCKNIAIKIPRVVNKISPSSPNTTTDFYEIINNLETYLCCFQENENNNNNWINMANEVYSNQTSVF